MAFWTTELERTDSGKDNEHVERELIENEVMEIFVPHEEPIFSLHDDYVTRFEVEKLMNNYMKTAVEAATTGLLTGIVNEKIERAFARGYNIQKEGMKTPIRNMVKGVLIDVIEQRRLETLLIRNVDKFASSARFMDALMGRVVGNKSLGTMITPFVKR